MVRLEYGHCVVSAKELAFVSRSSHDNKSLVYCYLKGIKPNGKTVDIKSKMVCSLQETKQERELDLPRSQAVSSNELK